MKICCYLKAASRFLSSHSLWMVLMMACITGLLFLFLVPPWMHYDEPGHFEYAWLAANKPGWPAEGDYDQHMRREMAASLIEHDFPGYTPSILLQIDKPISIITPQTGDVPLYYFLASLPLRLFRDSDITFQLYLVRFVSFGMFIATVWISSQAMKTLLGRSHPLTWMVPFFLATLPSFVDIMTAANNDVGAIFGMSLFFYASTLVLKNQLSWKNGLFLAGSLAICVLSKSTAWLALPLTPFVLLLAFLKRKHRVWIWAAIILGLVLIPLLLLTFKNTSPAYFFSNQENIIPKTIDTWQAPVGDVVISFSGDMRHYLAVYQMLSPEANEAIQGKTITLGAYIWADEPVNVRFPVIQQLYADSDIVFHQGPIHLSTTPQFFAFNAEIPETVDRVSWIRFFTVKRAEISIYYDGIVLLPDEIAFDRGPMFLDKNAEVVENEDKTYQNLVRNGSGEKKWPMFSTRFQKLLFNPLNFNATKLFLLVDFQSISWYFKIFVTTFFRSFWGVFGWGEVPMLGNRPYRVFIVLSGVVVLGMLLELFLRKRQLSYKALILILTVIFFQFVMVSIRGLGSWFVSSNPMIPLARYFFPVLIPVGILTCSGLNRFFCFIQEKIKVPLLVGRTIYILGFGMIISWALLSIVRYFQ